MVGDNPGQEFQNSLKLLLSIVYSMYMKVLMMQFVLEWLP